MQHTGERQLAVAPVGFALLWSTLLGSAWP